MALLVCVRAAEGGAAVEAMKAVRLIAAASAGAPGEEVPRRVCAAVVEGLEVDGVTVSLLTDTPARQLLAASNDAALLLEEIQFTVLEGPCISAAETGEPVAVDDLRRELVPWPLFGTMAREKLPEVRSVYALPLFFGDYVLGSVDLLAMRPHALSEDALEQASHVADAVAAALMPTREMLLTGDKGPAWQPEQVIRAHWFDTWRAVGVLAARSRIAPEDALALMRAEAFSTGRSLTDITQNILEDPPRMP